MREEKQQHEGEATANASEIEKDLIQSYEAGKW